MCLPNASKSKNNKTSLSSSKPTVTSRVGTYVLTADEGNWSTAFPGTGIHMAKGTKARHMASAEILLAYKRAGVKTQVHSLSKEMF